MFKRQPNVMTRGSVMLGFLRLAVNTETHSVSGTITVYPCRKRQTARQQSSLSGAGYIRFCTAYCKTAAPALPSRHQYPLTASDGPMPSDTRQYRPAQSLDFRRYYSTNLDGFSTFDQQTSLPAPPWPRPLWATQPCINGQLAAEPCRNNRDQAFAGSASPSKGTATLY